MTKLTAQILLRTTTPLRVIRKTNLFFVFFREFFYYINSHVTYDNTAWKKSEASKTVFRAGIWKTPAIKRHKRRSFEAWNTRSDGSRCVCAQRAAVRGSRRRSYIQRGSKWEEEGGHRGSRRGASGGNGRGSVVAPWHEWTMFGNGGLALPVCSFLLLHLPLLPPTGSWPVKVISLTKSCASTAWSASSGSHNGEKFGGGGEGN